MDTKLIICAASDVASIQITLRPLLTVQTFLEATTAVGGRPIAFMGMSLTLKILISQNKKSVFVESVKTPGRESDAEWLA
jgi:hypothetical protein